MAKLDLVAWGLEHSLRARLTPDEAAALAEISQTRVSMVEMKSAAQRQFEALDKLIADTDAWVESAYGVPVSELVE